MQPPITRARALLAALMIASMLGGCAFPQLSGSNAESESECRYTGPNDPADPDNKIYPTISSALVKKIELTDQGELKLRCQWTDLLYELRVSQPKVIVMYLHGWKHDADDDDKDLNHFKDYIAQLTEREKSRSSSRQVVGIYVGWKGSSIRLPIAEELTYWSRQRAADRISQSSIVSKLVGAITSVRRKAQQSNDLVVFIGHSFGARILYTATSQLILYNLQNQHPGEPGGTYGVVCGPAHLTILLNPALEASAYTALNTVRRIKEKFGADQQPVVLTVSTSNDWATRIAFPIGQWFGTMWHEREMTTIGNYAPYLTHSLKPDSEKQQQGAVWWYDSFCNGTLCLRRNEQQQPGNPFIVASTAADVLDGHNGIWKPDFVHWLDSFIDSVDSKKSMAPSRPGEISVP